MLQVVGRGRGPGVYLHLDKTSVPPGTAVHYLVYVQFFPFSGKGIWTVEDLACWNPPHCPCSSQAQKPFKCSTLWWSNDPLAKTIFVFWERHLFTKANRVQFRLCNFYNCHPVGSVGRAPDCWVGGCTSRFEVRPAQHSWSLLKITEKVLPLLWNLRMS